MDTDKFLEMQIAKRKADGLWITILGKDGTLVDLYPKDEATKQNWIGGYKANGIVILRGDN